MTTVGLFDSGVGGLSVLTPLIEFVPTADYIYIADQAYCPYGSLPPHQIRARSFALAEALLGRGATLIVVACNTASSAALTALRERYPNIPFVGMEPAVKPAAQRTRTGHVGVLATTTTTQGERLADLIDQFGRGVEIHVHVPEGLVQLVESGAGESEAAAALLAPTLNQWLQAGVDTIVLGCTHYPFARRTIQRLAGPHVEIIDPAPAVARRAAALLAEMGFGGLARYARSAPEKPARGSGGGHGGQTRPPANRPQMTFLTTGDPITLRTTIHHLATHALTTKAHFTQLPS